MVVFAVVVCGSQCFTAIVTNSSPQGVRCCNVSLLSIRKLFFFTAVPIGMHIVHMCTHAYIIPCINMHIGCGVWNIYFYEDHKNFPTLCMFMAFNLIAKIQLFLEHPSLWVRVEIPTFRRACNYHLHDARSHGNASSLQFFKAGLYECRS